MLDIQKTAPTVGASIAEPSQLALDAAVVAAKHNVILEFVSPTDAERMLAAWAYPGQRPVKPFAVARYARRAKLGRWELHEIRVCVLGGRKFLTDGQHRLHAIIVSGIGQWFHIHEILCVDDAEVAKDYNSNGGGVSRTQADELRASGIDQRLELSVQRRNVLAAAARIILTEFSAKPSLYLNYNDHDDKQFVMEEYAGAFTLYCDAVYGASSLLPRALKLAGVVAVGLVTFDTNSEMADAFWREVAREQTYFPAINHLQKRLIALRAAKSSQPYVARVVAHAWNKWQTSPYGAKGLSASKDVDTPIRIWGTKSYTGRQTLSPMQLSVPAARNAGEAQ